MNAFEVGQVIEHRQMPELGRVRVEHISSDQVRVLVEHANGGEIRTFRLPNEHFFQSKDQSSGAFDVPKATKVRAKKKSQPRVAKVKAAV